MAYYTYSIRSTVRRDATKRPKAEAARAPKVLDGTDPDSPYHGIADTPAADLLSLTKAELVAQAEARGIDASGTKADIVARLESS